MVSRLTLLSHALFAWGAVVALVALPFEGTWWAVPLAIAAFAAGTGGLVVGIIGAATYDGL